MIPRFLAVAETQKGDPFALLLLVVLIAVFVVWMLINNKKKKKAAAAASAPVVAEERPQPEAPGSAGHLKLHTVDPKTAAMLMAIVADKLGKPLNELRFISIREVEEDEV